jgi:hypothetical protein
MFRDVAAGMATLHRAELLHPQLQLSGCVVRRDTSVAISDVGIAEIFNPLPEGVLSRTEGGDCATDVLLYGLMIAEAVFGVRPAGMPCDAQVSRSRARHGRHSKPGVAHAQALVRPRAGWCGGVLMRQGLLLWDQLEEHFASGAGNGAVPSPQCVRCAVDYMVRIAAHRIARCSLARVPPHARARHPQPRGHRPSVLPERGRVLHFCIGLGAVGARLAWA